MISVNGWKIDEKHFPDNSLFLKMPSELIEKNSITIFWNYQNDGELFTIICLKKYFHDKNVSLVMPYCPHARMDRVKQKEDVFTLKFFCETINDLKFNSVWILDPHSDVAPALLDRVAVVSPEGNIESVILREISILGGTERPVIFFPDNGAMKRYAEMIPKNHGVDIVFGIKNRDWGTGKILSYEVSNPSAVKNRNILIIDDICSKGGTFYHAAKSLKAVGAKDISLYVTHCENTILQGNLFAENILSRIYTTKSLIHNDELKKKLIYV